MNDEFSTPKELEDVYKFKSKLLDQEIFNVGAMPPEDGDAAKWVLSSIESPMPVQYTLTSIKEALKLVLT